MRQNAVWIDPLCVAAHYVFHLVISSRRVGAIPTARIVKVIDTRSLKYIPCNVILESEYWMTD